MGAGFSDLLIAMATFVSGHFILSSLPVRHALIEWIGDTGFRILYSVLAGVTLYWTINRYGAAPYQEVWPMVPALMPGLMLIMLPACLLFAAALTTRLPTAVGGERMVQDTKPLGGIMTVTRHPMLWSFVLWALGHGVVNGDVASLILFGGIAVLSLGGMAHIDHRRQHQTGAEWGPIALSTSAVPFLAAIQGRTKIDWAGIGLARLALGLALYAGLLVAHRWIAGVALVNFG